MFSLNGKSNAGGMIIGLVIFAAIVGLIFSLPIMWLWNGCLVGAVSGVNEISWLQAWGLTVLINLLFKTSISPKE